MKDLMNDLKKRDKGKLRRRYIFIFNNRLEEEQIKKKYKGKEMGKFFPSHPI